MCLPCPVCNQQTFDSCVTMLRRLIQVANDSLTCPVCRETFVGLDKFTIHLFSHADDKKPDLKTETTEPPKCNKPEGIECDTCGFNFQNSSTLEMHKKIVHANSNATPKYPCHLCSKSFKMRGSLMVHLRMVHFGMTPSVPKKEIQDNNNEEQEPIKDSPISPNESNGKQWSCDICLKAFTTKYFLKKHKRLHTGEMPYSCNQCGKMFTFQQSYHKHLLYHNDEKPHACNQCGRTFKELSTLHNHQRIHTGEKPFSCETCGKSFRQRVSYLVHKRIHTGIMPYKCTACDKSFRHKVSQRTHKCTAQPPGVVVRQPCDLVEKLKKNQSIIFGNKGRDNNNVNRSSTPKSPKRTNVNESSIIGMENVAFESDKEHFLEFQDNNNILDQIVEESIKKIQQDTNDFFTPITDFYSMVTPERESVPSPSEKLRMLTLASNNENEYNL